MDEYEKGLYYHSTKKENVKFSMYIKRLVERDREGVKISNHVLTQDIEND